MVLCFCGGLGFLQDHSQLWSSSLPFPQAVSSQPTAVPSPSLLSKPSPCAHWQTPISGCCVQCCGMDHLFRSHSVLPATNVLMGSCPSPWSSPSVPAALPASEGHPQMWKPLLSFSSPPGAQVLSCFLSSSFFLLPFVLLGYVGIFLVLFGVRGPLLVFSRCSVRIVPFVDVFFMCLWGESNSTSSFSSAIFFSPKSYIF